jgi:hypothetical protein
MQPRINEPPARNSRIRELFVDGHALRRGFACASQAILRRASIPGIDRRGWAWGLLLAGVDKLKFVLQGFAELLEDVITSEGFADEVGHVGSQVH